MSLKKMDNFNRVAFRKKYRSLDFAERKGENYLEGFHFSMIYHLFRLGVKLSAPVGFYESFYGGRLSLTIYVSFVVVGKAQNSLRAHPHAFIYTLHDRYED